MPVCRFLTTLFLLLFLSANQATEKPRTVSGKVTIHLPRDIDAQVFYQLTLLEKKPGNKVKELSKQAVMPVVENTAIPFSLNFAETEFNPHNRYFVVIRLTQNNNLLSELMTSRYPVLTHGYPSDLYIAIRIPPRPIE